MSISVQKILGCLLGSLPTIICLIAVGALVSPDSKVGNWTHQPGGASMQPLLFLVSIGCLVIVVCELTVLWSLIVNWGALPLAIGCVLILLTVFFPVLSGITYVLREQNQPGYAQIGPIIYVTGMISVVLQFEILRRVEALSGR